MMEEQDEHTSESSSPKTVLVKIEIPLTVLFNYDNHWPTTSYPGDLLENIDLENFNITPPNDAWFTADVRRRRSFEHNIDPDENNPGMYCCESSRDESEIRDEDDLHEEVPECEEFDDEMSERRSKSNIWRWKQVLKQKGFRKIQSELNNSVSNDYQSNLMTTSPVPSIEELRVKRSHGKRSFRNAKDSKRTNVLREDYGLVATSSSGVDTCCLSTSDDARTFSTPSLFVESVNSPNKTNGEVSNESVKRDINGSIMNRKVLIRPSSAEGPRPRMGNETVGISHASAGKGRRIIANESRLKCGTSKTLMKSKSVETDLLITDSPFCRSMLGATEENRNESVSHHNERLSTPTKRPTSATHAGSRTLSRTSKNCDDATLSPDLSSYQPHEDPSSFNSELVVKFKTVDFDTARGGTANEHRGNSVKKSDNSKFISAKQKCVASIGSIHVSNKLIKHVFNDLVVDVIKDVLGDVIKTLKSDRKRPKDLTFTRAEFRPEHELISLSRTTISKPDWLKCRSLPASLKPDVMLNGGGGVNGLQYHTGDIYSQLVESVTPTFIVGDCTHSRQLNIYGLGSATRVSPPRRDLQHRRPSRVMDEVKALTHRLRLLPVGKSESNAGVSTSIKHSYTVTPTVFVGLSIPGDSENLSLPIEVSSCPPGGGTLKHADSTDSGVESESYRGLDKVIADITADMLDIHEEGEALATQLLALCRDIQRYKFQRYYQLHHDTMQAAMDEDEDQKTELGQQLIDLIPQRFCETLRPWGVTRNHLRQRRFSIF